MDTTGSEYLVNHVPDFLVEVWRDFFAPVNTIELTAKGRVNWCNFEVELGRKVGPWDVSLQP